MKEIITRAGARATKKKGYCSYGRWQGQDDGRPGYCAARLRVWNESADAAILQRQMEVRELARKVAVLPQQFVVPFAFTVREIVQLERTPHLHFLRGARGKNLRAVERAMELTNTLQLASRIFNELSGGERQRVLIAMALAQNPEILLLDEPTQQLDITRQAEILDLIADLNLRERLTIVAAIHELNAAARYFRRVIVLHAGALVADGLPQEVLRTDLLREVYQDSVEVLQLGGVPVILPMPQIRFNGNRL